MKPQAQALYNRSLLDFGHLADYQLMGLCIKEEAGGEPYEGRVGVGTVILERVDHRDWDGKTIQDVILWPYQFSWTLPSDPERADAVKIARDFDSLYVLSKPLAECVDIARGLIGGTVPRTPDLAAVNCCQYLNPTVAPKVKAQWLAAGMKVIKTIGRHQFFV